MIQKRKTKLRTKNLTNIFEEIKPYTSEMVSEWLSSSRKEKNYNTKTSLCTAK